MAMSAGTACVAKTDSQTLQRVFFSTGARPSLGPESLSLIYLHILYTVISIQPTSRFSFDGRGVLKRSVHNIDHVHRWQLPVQGGWVRDRGVTSGPDVSAAWHTWEGQHV